MFAPSLILKAIAEIGPRSLIYYLVYQLGLRSGYYRWRTPATTTANIEQDKNTPPTPVTIRRGAIHLPTQKDLFAILGDEGIQKLVMQADEVVSGSVRLFGGPPFPLEFTPPQPIMHWTEYEKKKTKVLSQDIRWVWEIGRFGWAFLLGRAYHICHDERYSNAFWRYAKAFFNANPTNMGPHWVSGQEIALRLMALAFAAEVFADSTYTTTQNNHWLGRTIAEHAHRLPLTLPYALAQNNNHLLVEAVGLFTAGLVLDQHPHAKRWQRLGARLFQWGICSQIAADGTYTQHSTNYHRLMLQVALWMWMLENHIHHTDSTIFSPTCLERLASATHWLLALLDWESGRVPNLGPNDGAYILPMTICPFDDHRPVLQSASLAFLHQDVLPPGIWDEMPLWFNLRRMEKVITQPLVEPSFHAKNNLQQTPHVLRSGDSHAYLRIARFHSRPGHADLLHVDLWWRGINLAQDPGSYLYNASPPWDNSLSRTMVHNTISINGLDQMRRAGRFLWLDWAKSIVISYEQNKETFWERLVAQHDGYRSIGVIHQRAIECPPGKWLVTDSLLLAKFRPLQYRQYTAHLHWLLPDWEWQINHDDRYRSCHVRVMSPHGWITLQLYVQATSKAIQPKATLHIVRAGELVYGSGEANPILGWVSPSYGYKVPALSVFLVVRGALPMTLISEWHLG